jgi:hypothetical protein
MPEHFRHNQILASNLGVYFYNRNYKKFSILETSTLKKLNIGCDKRSSFLFLSIVSIVIFLSVILGVYLKSGTHVRFPFRKYPALANTLAYYAE